MPRINMPYPFDDFDGMDSLCPDCRNHEGYCTCVECRHCGGLLPLDEDGDLIEIETVNRDGDIICKKCSETCEGCGEHKPGQLIYIGKNYAGCKCYECKECVEWRRLNGLLEQGKRSNGNEQ